VDANPEYDWSYFWLSSNDMYYWQDKNTRYVLK
jgi:hypothetical protein